MKRIDALRICTILLAAATVAPAQRGEDEVPLMRPDERRTVDRQSGEFNDALIPILKEAAKSTVRVWGKDRGGKPTLLAYGTVVGDGSQVLTKWSEVSDSEGTLQVRAGDKQSFRAEVAGVFSDEDLALLDVGNGVKVAPGDGGGAESASPMLIPAKFHVGNLSLGKFLTAPQPNGKPGAFGVVAVLERNLRETDQAHLGIMADPQYRGDGVKIANVQPEYGAAEAGLQAGDVILKVNDRTISGLQELKNSLSDKHPGEKVTLSVATAGKERSVEVVLSNRPVFGQFSGDRLNQMEVMGGKPNRVRGGFSRVVQSDMQIESNQVGGPVVDLQGRVVGITMARADRTRTYVMGSGAVMDLLKEKPDTIAEALTKSELKKQQLADQRRAIIPQMRPQGKPRDPQRMRRHLSDTERLLDRIRREREALGAR
jgi:membrane-associated protease RseP (regulator of RpoE activity)